MVVTNNKIKLSWQDIDSLILKVYNDIVVNDNWKPDIIVGITRGGLIPATMLSHMFNVTLTTLDLSLRDKLVSNNNLNYQLESFLSINNKGNSNNVLIVDDINDSGQTFLEIIDAIKSHLDSKFYSVHPVIKLASIIHNKPSSQKSDYVGRYIDKNLDPSWIIFPWENC